MAVMLAVGSAPCCGSASRFEQAQPASVCLWPLRLMREKVELAVTVLAVVMRDYSINVTRMPPVHSAVPNGASGTADLQHSRNSEVSPACTTVSRQDSMPAALQQGRATSELFSKLCCPCSLLYVPEVSTAM